MDLRKQNFRCYSVDKISWDTVRTQMMWLSILYKIHCQRYRYHPYPFDCLNDLRNLKTAVTAANKEKGHAQIALSYTFGRCLYMNIGSTLQKGLRIWGKLCALKIWQGLLLPYEATELIGALKDAISIPIQLHTHYTSGVASMTYMKAVEPEWMLLIRQCPHLLWEHPSRQRKLW